MDNFWKGLNGGSWCGLSIQNYHKGDFETGKTRKGLKRKPKMASVTIEIGYKWFYKCIPNSLPDK